MASLFDIVDNYEEVILSYDKIAETEIKYRGLNVDIKECLYDTFDAAASIMCRGKIDPESYESYLIGIKGLAKFLINTKFNAETAFMHASKVMYLTACIIKGVPKKKDIAEQELLTGKYSKLNYLRKYDKYYYNMAAMSVRLIEQE